MNITEMKAISKKKGMHNFDRDTMDFFGAVVETQPNKYNLFIESGDDFFQTARLYSVKYFNENEGTTTTLFFQKFKTLSESKSWLKTFMDNLKNQSANREKFVLENLKTIEKDYYQPEGVFKVSSENDHFLVNTNNYERFIIG